MNPRFAAIANEKTVHISSNMTLRLQLQQDDVMLWLRYRGMIFSPSSRPDILDVWRHVEGDSALITNRAEDLPDWFTLHPTECANQLAYARMASLAAGESVEDPVEGPHIWRVLPEDRLVWSGPPRNDSGDADDWLQIFTFADNAVVIGGPLVMHNDGPLFGMPIGSQSQVQLRRGTLGMAAAQLLGMPNSMSADGSWSLG